MARHLTALVIAVLISIGTPAFANEPSAVEVRRAFENPGKQFRPMARWWWPGNDVTPQELRAEIAEMDEAGFGGVEIQPVFLNFAASLPPEREARIRSVGTPGFYEHVRVVAEETRRRGMWTDLTLGSGWPSGGGSEVTPELAPVGLDFKSFAVTGGQHFLRSLDLPSTSISATGNFVHQALGDPIKPNPTVWDDRLVARAKTVAVLAFKGQAPKFGAALYPGALLPIERSGEIDPASLVDLTGKLTPDGKLDWQVPQGDWQVVSFRSMALADHVVGNAIPGGSLILDHLNRGAFDSFIRAFGDPLKSAPLRALFVDSLEIPTELNWSDDFRAEFQHRRGYDITPHLPYLMQFGYINGYNAGYSGPYYDGGAKGDAVRRDYWRTVGELIDERYYSPLNDWAARHRLLTRVQAHGAPGDLIKLYGDASIPETEQMIAQGSFDAMKLASSAANINGKHIVSSESFAAMGDPYWTNPQALIQKTDQMVVAGVNQIVWHGYPYKLDDRAFPGWSPFNTGAANASFASFMNSRNTFWPYVRHVNNYISRLQYLSQTGTNVASVAVVETRTGIDIHRTGDTPLTKMLVAAGYTFDFVNADALVRARIENGEYVLPSGTRYKAVIIVDNWLQSDLASSLLKSAKAGASVVFVGPLPSHGEGFADFEAINANVQAAVREITNTTRSRTVGNVNQLGEALAQIIEPDVKFNGSAGVTYLHKSIGALDVFFFRNPSDKPITLTAVIAAKGLPELWSAWDGKASALKSQTLGIGRQRVDLALPVKGSALVVFTPDGKRAMAANNQPVTIREMPIAGPWLFSARGHDGTDGEVEFKLKMEQLVDWTKTPSLAHFSGSGRYENSITLSAQDLTGACRVMLDLGAIADVAEVSVNGRKLPPLLMQPYRLDIRHYLRSGRNAIAITAVNALSNSAADRAASVEIPQFLWLSKTFKPLAAGLVGPVKLVIER